MEKIALSMICKGDFEEVKELRRCLKTVAPYVDGIFITLTGPRETLSEIEAVCKEFKVNVSYGEFLEEVDEKMVTWLKEFFRRDPFMKVGDKLFRFDKARNFNMEQISKDEYQWILWLDTDDILRRGENLRKIVYFGEKNQIGAFYFDYLYQVEGEEKETGYEVKNIIISHIRERLTRNNGDYKWIAPIHETLIEQKPTKKVDVHDCDVVHLATMDERMGSLTRNLKNLELSIYLTEGKDPRHLYYFAKALFDLNKREHDDLAIYLIFLYIDGEHKSGWPEERAQAWEYLADIYLRRGETNNSIKSCMNALMEQPESVSLWITLARMYVEKKDYERALFWVKVASGIQDKKSTLISSPMGTKLQILQIIYNSCLNLGRIDEAWAAITKVKELLPDDPLTHNAYLFMNELRTKRDLTTNILGLANFLKSTGERAKIKALLGGLPRIVEDNPFMIKLYQENNPPTPWENNEIAIYCGPGFTTWSPKKITTPGESFLGGSEEAVVYAAQSLAKLGWKVTVYNDPGEDEGEHDGVRYLPYYKFNRLDNFNILIGWRDIRFFDTDFKAKKKYLWCHDIQSPIEYTKERVGRIDKIFFLSNWHRDNVNTLDNDKVFITSNGVNI